MRCRACMLTVLFIAMAPVVLLVWQWKTGATERMPEPFRAAFGHFTSSEYLQELWEKTCDVPLSQEHIILMAEVDRSQATEHGLRCFWNEPPAGKLRDVGITFASEQTDVHGDWIACGTNAALAGRIHEAVHRTGSQHIHLGNAPPRDSSTLYVLVGRCHYWDTQSCKLYPAFSLCEREDAGTIMSAAYAVLDMRNHSIYW